MWTAKMNSEHGRVGRAKRTEKGQNEQRNRARKKRPGNTKSQNEERKGEKKKSPGNMNGQTEPIIWLRTNKMGRKEQPKQTAKADSESGVEKRYPAKMNNQNEQLMQATKIDRVRWTTKTNRARWIAETKIQNVLRKPTYPPPPAWERCAGPGCYRRQLYCVPFANGPLPLKGRLAPSSNTPLSPGKCRLSRKWTA